MKMFAIIGLGFALSAGSAQASEQTGSLCSQGQSKAECQAYIAGLVEGYVASKQNYLPKQPSFESRYIARAFDSRVGNAQKTSSKKPACLPMQVDTDLIVAHLLTSSSKQAPLEQLGDYLQDNYRCDTHLYK